jgi:hypothetical protein
VDGALSSQLAPDFLALDKLIVVRKQNVATDTATLILPAVGTNYERPPKLQSFMLANDSTTIAVEVPIWLTETDIFALEKQHGIELAPRAGDKPRAITGHIDFCKSETAPCTSSTTSQMRRRTSPSRNSPSTRWPSRAFCRLKLFDIKCTWFNENEYCEFFLGASRAVAILSRS